MYFLGTFSVLFGIFQTVTSHCDIYVDITNGIRDVDVIIKDDVVYTPDDYFEVGETIQGCICKVKKCLRRCCSEGEALNSTTGRCFQSTDDSSIPGIINFNIINVPENKICEERQYKIKINEDFSFMTGVLMWDNMQFNMKNFCLAITPMNTTYVVACVPNEETQVESIIMSFGMLISMPFLGVTFLVYVILPNPTIHKRALAAYVLSLLLAYICLVTVQLHNSNSGPIADIPCQLLGYSIVFFFTMSFCWLNVMSYDMWSTFKGIYRYSGNTANSSRFYYGLAYAITVPLILVIIILLTNSLLDTTNIGHPKLGLGRCFLDDGYPNLFYFYLPMALVISVNVVLFILTAVRIQQIKKETAMSFKQQESVKHAYEKEKQMFNLYLKLMLAMGVNWIMECISWLINWLVQPFPTAVWYITDFVNAAYGVFIFFIFVFNKKIWKGLQERYYKCIGKPHKARTLREVTRETRTDTSGQGEIPLGNVTNKNGDENPLTNCKKS